MNKMFKSASKMESALELTLDMLSTLYNYEYNDQHAFDNEHFFDGILELLKCAINLDNQKMCDTIGDIVMLNYEEDIGDEIYDGAKLNDNNGDYYEEFDGPKPNYRMVTIYTVSPGYKKEIGELLKSKLKNESLSEQLKIAYKKLQIFIKYI